MNWSEILKALINDGFVAAIIIFIGRRMFELWFSKDLEKFKYDLKKETIEFQIKYKLLQAERAKVIQTVYEKIVETDEKLLDLISPLQQKGTIPLPQKADCAAQAINDLIKFFDRKRIFFDRKTANSIEKIVKICKTSFYNFDLNQNTREIHRTDSLKEWNELWKKYRKESEKTKLVIEKKFRELIGV